MKKFLAAAVFALCLAACQDNGAQSANSSVQAYAGGVFFVELAANPSTGYSWNITNAKELRLVTLKSIENITKKTNEKIVGAPSMQRFEFTVNQGSSGKVEILKFAYFRPWETGVPPAEQKTYTVNIK